VQAYTRVIVDLLAVVALLAVIAIVRVLVLLSIQLLGSLAQSEQKQMARMAETSVTWAVPTPCFLYTSCFVEEVILLDCIRIAI